VLARLLRGEVSALAGQMRESLEALVGRSVQLERLPPDHPDLPRLFGERDLFLFPFDDREGRPQPTFFALDRPAAVLTGAAFSLMTHDQVRQALASGELPGTLLDAIREVAGILAGAARRILRSRQAEGITGFDCGRAVRRLVPGPWPAIVGEVDPGVPWDLLGFRLVIDGRAIGAILIGSSDRGEGLADQSADEDADTAEVPADELTIEDGGGTSAVGTPAPRPREDEATRPVWDIPHGIRVQVVADPTDRTAAALRAALAETGCLVMPVYSSGPAGAQPSVVFVVSRSAVDLRSRLAVAAAKRRAGLIVACSDRPTVELVRAARAAAADSFLVLPVDRTRLGHLFQCFAEVSLS
jgi:hypothetical protein